MENTAIALTHPLDQRVFFGFTEQDYQGMFALHHAERHMRILDFFGGLNSFSISLANRGFDIECCDQIPADRDLWLKKISQLATEFYLENEHFFYLKAPLAEWLRHRLDIAKQALHLHKKSLLLHNNTLLYPDNYFDLTVCAYWWFTYDHVLDLDTHLFGLQEMMRVSSEIRIFPLVNSRSQVSPHLGPMLLAMQNEGYGVEVKKVDFDFQNNADAMLRVWKKSCQL